MMKLILDIVTLVACIGSCVSLFIGGNSSAAFWAGACAVWVLNAIVTDVAKLKGEQ